MGRAEDIFNALVTSGEPALDSLIKDRVSEELFLDFKRANQMNSGRLNDHDQRHLAKAICGFGNSAGGVVVWGVDCKDTGDGCDVAKMKQPVQDAAQFKSLLESAISRCTMPPHSGVRNHLIQSSGTTGYVVTLVPESDSQPLQAVQDSRFLIRAGSSFVPAPYQVLAGMFGKSPQPRLDAEWHPAAGVPFGAHIRQYLLIGNVGPGISKRLYVVIRISNSYSIVGSEVEEMIDQHWQVTDVKGFRQVTFVAPPDFCLPPDGRIHLPTFEISLQPPYSNGLSVDVTVSCDNGATRKLSLGKTAEELTNFISLVDGNKATWDELFQGSKPDEGK